MNRGNPSILSTFKSPFYDPSAFFRISQLPKTCNGCPVDLPAGVFATVTHLFRCALACWEPNQLDLNHLLAGSTEFNIPKNYFQSIGHQFRVCPVRDMGPVIFLNVAFGERSGSRAVGRWQGCSSLSWGSTGCVSGTQLGRAPTQRGAFRPSGCPF